MSLATIDKIFASAEVIEFVFIFVVFKFVRVALPDAIFAFDKYEVPVAEKFVVEEFATCKLFPVALPKIRLTRSAKLEKRLCL